MTSGRLSADDEEWSSGEILIFEKVKIKTEFFKDLPKKIGSKELTFKFRSLYAARFRPLIIRIMSFITDPTRL